MVVTKVSRNTDEYCAYLLHVTVAV